MGDKIHFKRRELIKSISETFDEESFNNHSFRKSILLILKDYYQNYYLKINNKFNIEKNGKDAGLNISNLSDSIILSAYDSIIRYLFPQPNPTTSDKLSILAVGGYGRRQLSPGSDIDLLILTPYKLIPRTEQIVETLLYILWDMKIKVGYSIRHINETIMKAKNDNTICTSLLDARFIAGDYELWDVFSKEFKSKILNVEDKKYFFEKIDEQKLRHNKMGDSQYLLEPNIKEGKGGLRDIHTMKWIIYFLYGVREFNEFIEENIVSADDAKVLISAETFLINLRTIMHYKSDNFSDRLTFDLQSDIASFFGYKDKSGLRSSEILMKDYYIKVRSIGYLCNKILDQINHNKFKSDKSYIRKFLKNFAKDKEGKFEIYEGKIFLQKNVKKFNALDIFEVFRLLINNKLEISADLFDAIQKNLRQVEKIRENKKANKIFIDILLSAENSEIILKKMNESGVLGKFIPDFGKVVAQIQHDMYHVFTVDEHTLNAIGILRKIYSGEFGDEFEYLKNVSEKIISRKVLFIALFLHDIAKGRGGNHSVLGSKVAEKLCPRLGLKPEEVETVSWLVMNHLLMSNIAFKRDINDFETISFFCNEVQSVERLRLLYVLTVVDIKAVGPNIWNEWKNNLLTSLYEEALVTISGGSESKSRHLRIEKAKEVLKNNLRIWDKIYFQNYIDRFYSSYWTNVDLVVQERHANLINDADKSKDQFSIYIFPIKEKNVTEIAIYTQDHHGLFSKICAGLSLGGTSILDARIVTTKDGMAINTFLINNIDLVLNKNRLDTLKSTIFKSVYEERPPKEVLKELKNITKISRRDIIKIEPRILFDNFSSKTHTIIEINARDKIGLLSLLANALFDSGLQITKARISTYGLRAVDVFYVKDITGMKITDERKISNIKHSMANIIDEEFSGSNQKIKEFKIAQ